MTLSLARLTDRSRFSSGAVAKGLIWLFAIGLIAIGWLTALQQIRFEREQAVAEAIAQNENRVTAFEQYVQRTLEVATIATRYVAERFRRGEAGSEFLGTREAPAVLRGNLARTGTFIGIAIVNASGDLVATSRPGAGPLNVANNEAFRTHIERDTGELYVSQPITTPVLGRQVILLTRRLSNPDGTFAGVVSLIITPDQFTAFYRNAQVGPNDIMAVVGLDGVVRALRVGQTTSAGLDARGGRALREQGSMRSGTYRSPSRLDGVIRYVSHRRLADYPLFVTYGVPEAAVLAGPGHRARVLIVAVALGTLATLGFAIALTLLINRAARREAEMASANTRLEEAQRIGQIGDWTYDLRSGATYWSPQACRQFERSPEEGSPTFEEFKSYLSEESRVAIDRAHALAIETGESQQIEYEVRLPSGAVNRHQGWVIPTFDAAGKVIGLHGTDQNISGRKLLEQLQNRVAQLSRIDAMNAMATTLAHELNQPLAAAVNYLAGMQRRLEARPGGEPELREGLRAAEQQIHFAGDIIRRVREMVSNQPKIPSSFSLAPVVDDALALIASAQDGPQPKVAKQFAADARRVSADRVQVQQVLVNLLRNALEATETGGEIIVASRRVEPGVIQVTVADTGHGFRQPEAERFSPFVTKEGGLGLGLSLARTIVESHGGRIWTEDRDGGGAAVHFTLPAADRPAKREAEAEASA